MDDRVTTDGNTVSSCKLMGSALEIQGQVQQAELSYSPEAQQYTLFYETRTRTGTKSILQPLDTKLRNQEDGVAIGDKKLRNIRQFKFSVDRKKQQWISYKAQQKNSELTVGVVEFLSSESSKDLVRQILPAKRNESLQELWVLSNRIKGTQVSIVTRYNLNSDSPDTNTYFRWYIWDTKKNVTKIVSEQRISQAVPSQTRFFALPENQEPLAFAIMGGSQSSGPGTAMGQSFKISLWRPFLTNPQEIVLAESKSPLSDLNAELLNEDSKPSWLISWMQEAGSEGGQMLKWKSLEGFSTTRQLSQLSQKQPLIQNDPNQPEKSIPIEQDSLNLTSLVPKNETAQDQYIAWWSPTHRNTSTVRILNTQKSAHQTFDSVLPSEFSRVVGIGPIHNKKLTILLGKEMAFKQIEGGSFLRFCQIEL